VSVAACQELASMLAQEVKHEKTVYEQDELVAQGEGRQGMQLDSSDARKQLLHYAVNRSCWLWLRHTHCSDVVVATLAEWCIVCAES
jgi:hypothetical protein